MTKTFDQSDAHLIDERTAFQKIWDSMEHIPSDSFELGWVIWLKACAWQRERDAEICERLEEGYATSHTAAEHLRSNECGQ